jgi:hypothetical protein
MRKEINANGESEMTKFTIRSIATVTDASGMYRVRTLAVSERITTREAAESLVEYRSNLRDGFPVEIIEVSDEDYAAAIAGKLNGYAKASDLTAPWAPSPSFFEQQHANNSADLARANID